MTAKVTTFPLTRPIKLEIRLGHGSIRIDARDGLAEAVVRLTPRDSNSDVLDQVSVELQGTTLLVANPRQRGLGDLIGRWRPHRDSIDAVIEIPTDTAVKIATATAEVAVTGRCGPADVAAGASDVAFDTVNGDLRMRYGSAETRIGAVTGSAQLRGGTGAARFGEVRAGLDCAFGTGELSAGVVCGGVRARAGSGSVDIGAAHGDVDVALGSGPITIGLPAGLCARVSATSGSGQVRSDFPVENTQARGSQSITVRARTGHGDVRLLRSDVAAA